MRLGRFCFVSALLVAGGGFLGCSSETHEARPVLDPSESDAPADETPPKDSEGQGPDLDASTTPPSTEAPGVESGCGKTGAKIGLSNQTMTVAGKSRSYLRVVPKGYDPNKKLPLVVAFHTLGSNAAEARRDFGLEGPAAGGAVFIYPTALPSADFDDKNRWDLKKDSDDFKFVSGLLDEVTKNYCVDRERIFTTGFSNGGRMASLVGCYRGDVVRAVAPVATGGGNEPLPASGCVGEVAAWIALGDDDAEHTPPGIATRDFFVAANACKNTATPTNTAGCVAYDACKLGVTFCKYDGAHVWPAFAGGAIWKFFNQP